MVSILHIASLHILLLLFIFKTGVGAGICVKHKDTSVNLVTLYTATK